VSNRSKSPVDLRRLRRNGLIRRIKHTRTYVLTPKANASRSSSPSSTIACSGRWPQPTSHKPNPGYVVH
jgi:hypothetical protein